jgi:hypothetical protein
MDTVFGRYGFEDRRRNECKRIASILPVVNLRLTSKLSTILNAAFAEEEVDAFLSNFDTIKIDNNVTNEVSAACIITPIEDNPRNIMEIPLDDKIDDKNIYFESILRSVEFNNAIYALTSGNNNNVNTTIFNWLSANNKKVIYNMVRDMKYRRLVINEENQTNLSILEDILKMQALIKLTKSDRILMGNLTRELSDFTTLYMTGNNIDTTISILNNIITIMLKYTHSMFWLAMFKELIIVFCNKDEFNDVERKEKCMDILMGVHEYVSRVGSYIVEKFKDVGNKKIADG